MKEKQNLEVECGDYECFASAVHINSSQRELISDCIKCDLGEIYVPCPRCDEKYEITRDTPQTFECDCGEMILLFERRGYMYAGRVLE